MSDIPDLGVDTYDLIAPLHAQVTKTTPADLVRRLNERADACFHAEVARPYTAGDAELDLAAASELDRLRALVGRVGLGQSFREIKDGLNG